jgi:RHS repeat-associated protein
VIAAGSYTQPVFPGQMRTHADLYYNRYRDYDPTTGRYVQADPIGLDSDANPYAYAGNDPVNVIDPYGLQSQVRLPPRPMPRQSGQGSARFQPYPRWSYGSPNVRVRITGRTSIGNPGSPITTQTREYLDGVCYPSVSDLHTRGLRPAPGTRAIPEGIPNGWRIREMDGAGGILYYNPLKPNENVRVMQGNPSSKYPNSQAPYARQQNAAGTCLRKDGTPSPLPRGGRNDPHAHIPLDQFRVR